MTRAKNERKSNRLGRPDSPANIGWWHAQTESAITRHSVLLMRDVAERDLVRAWRGVMRAVAKATASWPARLADRVGPITDKSTARILAWADEPSPAAPRPRRYLQAAEVLAILNGSGLPPWPARANEILRRVASEGRGIELVDGHGWYPWDPASGIPSQPHIAPILRPLFEQLSSTFEGSAAERELGRVLRAPAPLPMPPRPATSLRAREQYRIAAAALKRRLTAGQRGAYRRREAALTAIEAALTRFRMMWFSIWPGHVEDIAGNREKALQFVKRLRTESLGALALDAGPRIDFVQELSAMTSPRPKRRKTRRTR